ncbi:hypothetical protein N7493_000212 [Penicillium malachiteum]|uniref:Uncharacterized protein n=1 Tax=Penicillium malachiteum TaxID=1324776 RepID=A0AAD6HVW9_9EURO|nr:hypothetical protein N7493_000212 [Penicillium malachiteum]
MDRFSTAGLPDVFQSEPILPSSHQEPRFPQVPQVPSSPPSVASDIGSGRKLRKPPSVTPRSFRRFFTPRSLLNSESHGNVVASREALRALTSPAFNRLAPAFTRSSESRPQTSYEDLPQETFQTPTRKRKNSFSSVASPLQSSPLKKVRVRSPAGQDVELGTTIRDMDLRAREHHADAMPKQEPVVPIVRSRALQTAGTLFMRTLEGTRANRLTIRSTYGAGWQDLTSNFHTRPEDRYKCISYLRPGRHTMPFCNASCNTNSLVAVGDEEGSIRLLDSSKDDKQGFSGAFLHFRPHQNSIMDLEFSSDDMLLATASGDQSSMIIDMTTQQAIHCLANHASSVKQVQFQPASGNKVLATCSRDGNVSIWDLRCKGFSRPAQQVRCSLESEIGPDGWTLPAPKMTYPHVLNTIHGAHRDISLQKLSTDKNEPAPVGRTDVTVTSLAFLPAGQENLFVTSSDASASVRLWDLRTAYSIRRGNRPGVPLSTTREPDTHIKYRSFGVTSMALGGDGSRLYTLCRDGTVYSYATSHLITGHAPELSLNNDRFRRSVGYDKEGLGPIYGFRHPRMQVSSFYVKLALRKATHDHPEMLAVGSSDQCPVLFPTEERFLQRPVKTLSDDNLPRRNSLFTSRYGLRRTNSGIGKPGRAEDTIPIYQSGTPLIEGHSKEVTTMSWTYDGDLVTVGDDYIIRCWREGPEARELRKCGETGGRRHKCGWADTKDTYDDEDE